MPCNLLLVDDEPNVPRAIRRSLRNEGYHFLVASSADEAFDLLRASAVDVVISDHRMPGANGTEFLAEVSDRYPDTVRLMLSGEADLDAVIDAMNAGEIFKFLSKPWDVDRLKLVVRQAADKAQSRHIDDQTGWQTRNLFIERLSCAIEESSACVVVGEIRNVALLWALLDEPQRRRLASQIEARCMAAGGEPIVGMAAIDRGLFAFALAGGTSESVISGIVDRLSAPFDSSDQAVRLQVAVGYVDSTDLPQATPEQLLGNAITALAQLENPVRGYAGYRAGSEDDLMLRHDLERDLNAALAKRQFFTQLQPQVDTHSLQVRSGEALVRWQHPEHGLIAPSQFIDMAEANGFINDLGIWVMVDTMQRLEELQDAGIEDIRLSVNVSPRQFTAGPTASWVMLLHQFAVEQPELTRRLEIEVTESTVMSSQRDAIRLLDELRELGLTVALDDFGTGHSSIAQLKGIPVDVLKLDRTLVLDIDQDPRSLKLVSHLVQLAKDLGMQSVIEGIETEAQVRACQEIGCDLIQGYAFYRPLDVDDFFAILRNQRDV